MTKTSAGLLIYRRQGGALEVFLVHPGGPFWANKDAAAWSIPKGEFDPAEDPLDAARREFEEETGLKMAGEFTPLAPVRQAGGKVVHAFALEGDCDPAAIQQQHLRDRMAAALRQAADVPRGRPRGLVPARCRARQDPQRTGGSSGSAPGDARG